MKASKWLQLVALLGIVCIIAGCATIVNGTSQKITINTTPSQANVVITSSSGEEIFRGATPSITRLSKKREYSVIISLSGYKDQTVHIGQEFNAWFLGNVICGGLIGVIIDAVDGAMWKLDPDQITVSLATASLEGGGTQKYAIFRAIDSEGQLRSIAVPLIKDNSMAVK